MSDNTNPLKFQDCLGKFTQVIHNSDLGKHSVGLRRLDPPETALVTDMFLTCNLVDQGILRQVIHYGFYVVNQFDPVENVWTVSSLLDKTHVFLVQFPQSLFGLSPGALMVVHPESMVSHSTPVVRNFCRQWAPMAINLLY